MLVVRISGIGFKTDADGSGARIVSAWINETKANMRELALAAWNPGSHEL